MSPDFFERQPTAREREDNKDRRVESLRKQIVETDTRTEQRHVELLAAIVVAGYIAAGGGNEKIDEPIAARSGLHAASEIIRQNREIGRG